MVLSFIVGVSVMMLVSLMVGSRGCSRDDFSVILMFVSLSFWADELLVLRRVRIISLGGLSSVTFLTFFFVGRTRIPLLLDVDIFPY